MSPGTRTAAWRAHPPWVRAVLGVYVLAFAVGTATHLDALLHGWGLAHHPLVNAYWTLLVVVDPVVIWLVLRVPRAGLAAALVTMLTDVGINSAVSYLYFSTPAHYAVNDFVQLQTLFLGFVFGSASIVVDALQRKSGLRLISGSAAVARTPDRPVSCRTRRQLRSRRESNSVLRASRRV